MDDLIEKFKRFPGIGSRQAKRFAHFLLTQSKEFNNALAKNITDAKKRVSTCTRCYRLCFASEANTCDICRSQSRDGRRLLIVEKDSDLDNIEQQGVYDGFYFVLGGNLPVVEKNPEKQIRIRELFDTVQSRAKNGDLEELIIATSANPEGENTARFIKNKLEPLKKTYGITISVLGRGLSTGTELEYIDADTMKSALKNRR